MICPKCKANIGVHQVVVASVTGLVAGQSCYICGHWHQETTVPQAPHQTVPQISSQAAGLQEQQLSHRGTVVR